MDSLQTHVFENGRWVARTVTAQELMRDRGESKRIGKQPRLKPPTCGILTKTLIESPVVRWILPVQLRSRYYQDIALVGDHSVQICEFRQRDETHHVVQKMHFDSRIRAASVLGAPKLPANEHGQEDFAPWQSTTPEQWLVLLLEAGELVFVHMDNRYHHDWEFITTRYRIPLRRQLVSPRSHMTIDPSWKYLSLACSKDVFIVFELESIDILCAQFLQEELSLQPVRSSYARSVNGIICNMEFLEPPREGLVILALILVQAEVSRLVFYEWHCDLVGLEAILSKKKSGYRLEDVFRVPLLIIPLKVDSAFLIVTEEITAVCSQFLIGPPKFDPFDLGEPETEIDVHHGTRPPLWTAWTRPIRDDQWYNQGHDNIYLAREDGLISLIEVRGGSGIETTVNMSFVDCNVDTAFGASYHPFHDLLLVGGDCGPGSYWELSPKTTPRRIGSDSPNSSDIPNWSPTVDFVVIKDPSVDAREEHQGSHTSTPLPSRATQNSLAPDRLFACSGRGARGSIAEIRFGIEAKIGSVLPYSSPIKRCWVLPSMNYTDGGYFSMLLALPNASAVLRMSLDLSNVTEENESETSFDVTSPTLAAYTSGDVVVQVTATRITIVTPTECYQHGISELTQDPSAVGTHAAIADGHVALAIYSASAVKLAILDFDAGNIALSATFELDHDVSCLSIERLCGTHFALAGLVQSTGPVLVVYPIGMQRDANPGPALELLDLQRFFLDTAPSTEEDSDRGALGALTSIVSAIEHHPKATVFAGTRNGNVLTLVIDTSELRLLEISRHKFGLSPSYVSMGVDIAGRPSALVCNEIGLAALTARSQGKKTGFFEDIHRIWLTDQNDPSMPSPSINTVALMNQIPIYGTSNVVMIDDSRILITELQSRPKSLPRFLALRGMPMKILYSSRLGALLTIVIKNLQPSLHFIDPITGEDLSYPVGADDHPNGVDHISGLGRTDTRILSMVRWRYKKGEKIREWFVLTGKVVNREGELEGCLIVVSAKNEPRPEHAGGGRRVRFWTHYRWKSKDGPVWSATTDEQGLLVCQGKNLQYLTIVGNKLDAIKQHELPSPASWMQVVGPKRLHVVTKNHSLMAFNYGAEESDQMVPIHTDEVCHVGLHSIEVGSFLSEDTHQSITLLSDVMCSVFGLWSTSRNERPFQHVFRAELQASIRRFAQGRTRPPWDVARCSPRYGRIQAGHCDEILGLSIDGSMQQFSFVDEDAWRLLKYIQNLAMRFQTQAMRSQTQEQVLGLEDNQLELDPVELDPEPKLDSKLDMHVDGDVLQRVLDKRPLSKLVKAFGRFERLRELLDALEGGIHTPRSKEKNDYYKLAHEILRYYLSPAL
ncbi:mono-functional DNA-alkylating methyl methanesulfonate N-term-domain-containing protein [Xylariaceae sp. FL0804]|nr:mono-functional DNA-alkylating methyl methanesulfonate N-term-domain-containing protein [Xylariaceae sp. FL0804]